MSCLSKHSIVRNGENRYTFLEGRYIPYQAQTRHFAATYIFAGCTRMKRIDRFFSK
jgi:hypothetical protein